MLYGLFYYCIYMMFLVVVSIYGLVNYIGNCFGCVIGVFEVGIIISMFVVLYYGIC